VRTILSRRQHLPIVSLLGALACLVLLAACGGSSSGTGESPTATLAPTATTAPATATPTQSGGNTSATATITMGFTSFTGTTSVTIKAGQAVKFDDSNGATHILVIGTNGMFHAQNGAPPELNSDSGTDFNGDTKTITFPTAGTYQITCKIHPSMLATVTVQ
jgi:plastocyanin